MRKKKKEPKIYEYKFLLAPKQSVESLIREMDKIFSIHIKKKLDHYEKQNFLDSLHYCANGISVIEKTMNKLKELGINNIKIIY